MWFKKRSYHGGRKEIGDVLGAGKQRNEKLYKLYTSLTVKKM